MKTNHVAVFATPRVATIFGALERDCTVAIEHPFRGVDLWEPYRVVQCGTADATNAMLFDGVVADALQATEGGRHGDE